MYEENVDKYTLEDALRLSLADYLNKNYQTQPITKGLNGTVGKCVENSIAFDSARVSIGFCVFTGEEFINTISILVHAVNYTTSGELVDNTDLNDYVFYEIKRLDEVIAEEDLQNLMKDLCQEYQVKALKHFDVMFKGIKPGAFSFDL
jgi:hypothetical protein